MEYLTKLGIPLEDVKALKVEQFSLAYKAIHDKAPSDIELNYIKKFLGVGVSSVPDTAKGKEPTLSETDDGFPPGVPGPSTRTRLTLPRACIASSEDLRTWCSVRVSQWLVLRRVRGGVLRPP